MSVRPELSSRRLNYRAVEAHLALLQVSAHFDRIARRESAFQDFERQRVLDKPLDGAIQSNLLLQVALFEPGHLQ